MRTSQFRIKWEIIPDFGALARGWYGLGSGARHPNPVGPIRTKNLIGGGGSRQEPV